MSIVNCTQHYTVYMYMYYARTCIFIRIVYSVNVTRVMMKNERMKVCGDKERIAQLRSEYSEHLSLVKYVKFAIC